MVLFHYARFRYKQNEVVLGMLEREDSGFPKILYFQ